MVPGSSSKNSQKKQPRNGLNAWWEPVLTNQFRWSQNLISCASWPQPSLGQRFRIQVLIFTNPTLEQPAFILGSILFGISLFPMLTWFSYHIAGQRSETVSSQERAMISCPAAMDESVPNPMNQELQKGLSKMSCIGIGPRQLLSDGQQPYAFDLWQSFSAIHPCYPVSRSQNKGIQKTSFRWIRSLLCSNGSIIFHKPVELLPIHIIGANQNTQ